MSFGPEAAVIFTCSGKASFGTERIAQAGPVHIRELLVRINDLVQAVNAYKKGVTLTGGAVQCGEILYALPEIGEVIVGGVSD